MAVDLDPSKNAGQWLEIIGQGGTKGYRNSVTGEQITPQQFGELVAAAKNAVQSKRVDPFGPFGQKIHPSVEQLAEIDTKRIPGYKPETRVLMDSPMLPGVGAGVRALSGAARRALPNAGSVAETIPAPSFQQNFRAQQAAGRVGTNVPFREADVVGRSQLPAPATRGTVNPVGQQGPIPQPAYGTPPSNQLPPPWYLQKGAPTGAASPPTSPPSLPNVPNLPPMPPNKVGVPPSLAANAAGMAAAAAATQQSDANKKATSAGAGSNWGKPEDWEYVRASDTLDSSDYMFNKRTGKIASVTEFQKAFKPSGSTYSGKDLASDYLNLTQGAAGLPPPLRKAVELGQSVAGAIRNQFAPQQPSAKQPAAKTPQQPSVAAVSPSDQYDPSQDPMYQNLMPSLPTAGVAPTQAAPTSKQGKGTAGKAMSARDAGALAAAQSAASIAQSSQKGAGAAPTPTDTSVVPNTSSGRPDYKYYADMLNAADSNDAYYRDFLNLRNQARAAAREAAASNMRYQFVPIRDDRANRIYFVNADGSDVVLDMGKPEDVREYRRVAEKIGIDINHMSDWMDRSSKPLARYNMPPGTNADTSPDFGFWRKLPSTNADGAVAAAPRTSGEPGGQMQNPLQRMRDFPLEQLGERIGSVAKDFSRFDRPSDPSTMRQERKQMLAEIDAEKIAQAQPPATPTMPMQQPDVAAVAPQPQPQAFTSRAQAQMAMRNIPLQPKPDVQPDEDILRFRPLRPLRDY